MLSNLTSSFSNTSCDRKKIREISSENKEDEEENSYL